MAHNRGAGRNTSPIKSCHCFSCRHAKTARHIQTRLAWRTLRQKTRLALAVGQWEQAPTSISIGYVG